MGCLGLHFVRPQTRLRGLFGDKVDDLISKSIVFGSGYSILWLASIFAAGLEERKECWDCSDVGKLYFISSVGKLRIQRRGGQKGS